MWACRYQIYLQTRQWSILLISERLLCKSYNPQCMTLGPNYTTTWSSCYSNLTICCLKIIHWCMHHAKCSKDGKHITHSVTANWHRTNQDNSTIPFSSVHPSRGVWMDSQPSFHHHHCHSLSSQYPVAFVLPLLVSPLTRIITKVIRQ